MNKVAQIYRKPAKPYADFPLFPHATRRWAKKIRGKLHYFGPWDDPDGALKRYLDQREDLHAGRSPRVQPDGLTIRDLANHFLTTKQHQLDTGEITLRTFDDYHRTCQGIIDILGKTRLVVDLAALDFVNVRTQLAKTRGLVAMGNEVQRIRTVFKYGYDAGLIEKPVRFGPAFRRPSKKALRKARQESGPRMFEATEIKAMLESTDQPLKAMILLGINCGFGNNDVATLPIKSIDMETAWVSHPRPKTGVERRVPLWPETLEALEDALASRPEPKDESHLDLMFITKYGRAWSKQTSDNPTSNETAKLLKKLGVHRPGLNFYALRHTFETIAGETRDQVAVDHIMGHARDDMASVYRERISDERLKAVTDFVREWLFGPWFRKAEILSMLESAGTQLRAMILLGINCGLGEGEVAGLTLQAVDLVDGYIEHTISDTGVKRRIPLWPETAEALKEALAARPESKTADARDLVFVMGTGRSCTSKKGGSAIGREVTELLENLDIERPGLDFEALRRTFQEIGREHAAGQPPYTQDPAGTHGERISDERLLAMTDFVHRWLFGKAERGSVAV